MEVLVIGTGSIGSRHLQVLANLPGVTPLALPLRPERRAVLAEAGYWVCDSPAVAAERGARLAIVATDTRRHLSDALAAMRAGLDILVEKPLAAEAVQARDICRAAQEAGRKVFVGCNLRFSESLNAFRAALAQLGHLHAVRIECQSYLPDWRPGRPYAQSYSARADEGGVLRDLIHEIDYAGWLFGWPAAVQGAVRNTGRLGIAADEAADLLWETTGKTAVSIRLDYLTRPTRRRMCVSGEHGTLEWDGVAGKVTLALAGHPAHETLGSQDRDEMYQAQAQAFVQTAQGVSDPRLATGADGVKALAVCDAVRRASERLSVESVSYE